MEKLRNLFASATLNWDRALNTVNHLGLAMVIAGWLQALVTGAPVNWLLFVVGWSLIFISLPRYSQWTISR